MIIAAEIFGWSEILKLLRELNRRRLASRKRRIALSLSKEVIPEFLPFSCDYRVNVLTPAHTVYIGKQLAAALNAQGVRTQICLVKPDMGWGAQNLWVVICPQVYEELPDEYIAFQMEQSSSSKYFDDKYTSILKNAKLVLDYSIENVQFLQGKGLTKVWHCPIEYAVHPSPALKRDFEYDIAFYGDVKCDRRQQFLAALSKRFKVKIVSKLFGVGLIEVLSKARCVVNIHYYENALLETARLYECLSHHILVVSEAARDQDQHTTLNAIVDFSPIGDIEGMMSVVGRLVELGDDGLNQRILTNKVKLSAMPRWDGEGMKKLIELVP
jgi:hypothetical protein